jgi:uncharacterized protein YndB with AHSA1/START domain
MTKAATTTPVVRLERTINATPERVFDAWLDPAAMSRFMRMDETTQCDVVNDPRVGGRYLMTVMGKNTYPHTGEYLEITRPSKLVFTWYSKGTSMQATTVTVELKPGAGGTTQLTLTHVGLPEPAVAGHTGGWTSILDKMVANFAQ